MSVRSTVKGICVHKGRVLLNRCRDDCNGDYYSLPGGGQEQYETLAQALEREMLEETGYQVVPGRFAGLFEEICESEQYRAKYPQYAHKMYHFFLCSLESEEALEPTERDSAQLSCEWIPIGELGGENILPKAVGEKLAGIIAGENALFFGTDHTNLAHG